MFGAKVGDLGAASVAAGGRAIGAAAAVIATLALLATAPDAHAQSQPALEARHLYEEGARWYRQAEYEKAVVAFERAFAISQAKPLLFNIAQAYRLAGRPFCARAQQAYERYLREDPAASNASEVTERINEMRACVAAQRPESIAAPVPAAAEAGTPPAAPTQAVTSLPVPPPPTTTTTTTTTTTMGMLAAPLAHGDAPGPIALAPRLTLGLGIAALASGGILYWRARAKFDDVAPKCPCPEGEFSEWQAISNTSYALLALGSVAALAGGVWWALDARNTRGDLGHAQAHAPRRPQVGLSVAPRGLSLAGVF